MGEPARSANRPELQKMLAYLRQAGDVDYVIVHKLDRLARNRADDVEINRAFEDVGVRLVSTSENIDQTPRTAPYIQNRWITTKQVKEITYHDADAKRFPPLCVSIRGTLIILVGAQGRELIRTNTNSCSSSVGL